MNNQMNGQNSALVQIHLRNTFYKNKFYAVLGLYLFSLVILIVLGYILYYLSTTRNQPLYFATDDVGRLIRDVPIDQPNMSIQDVMAWTQKAIEAANSWDFVNYRAQLQDAEKYFDTYGWTNYMKALTASNNLLALPYRKWIISAKAQGPLQRLNEGVLVRQNARVYAWKFNMPMRVTYYSPPAYDLKTSTFENYIVTVVVIRKELLTSDKGLAIYYMILNNASASTPNLIMPAS